MYFYKKGSMHQILVPVRWNIIFYILNMNKKRVSWKVNILRGYNTDMMKVEDLL